MLELGWIGEVVASEIRSSGHSHLLVWSASSHNGGALELGLVIALTSTGYSDFGYVHLL